MAATSGVCDYYSCLPLPFSFVVHAALDRSAVQCVNYNRWFLWLHLIEGDDHGVSDQDAVYIRGLDQARNFMYFLYINVMYL